MSEQAFPGGAPAALPASPEDWVGRTGELHDVLVPVPVRLLAATLDRDAPALQDGDPMPPLAHWLYFVPDQRWSLVGSDGHPKPGGLLPPVPLPRRMWAGGLIDFLRPLLVGDRLRRVSTIAEVTPKSGRSGALVFVRFRHEIFVGNDLVLCEHQDIVYRAAARHDGAGAVVRPARADCQFTRRVVPDPILLFRYSALTFNSHRIHYDRAYATGVEGYPGLVVQGPLVATLLVDLLRHERPDVGISAFAFKAVSPLFEHEAFDLCGRIDGDTAALWVQTLDHRSAMEATATLVTAHGRRS
jgi:3-methylfumaryl-CoA hydratase